MTAKAETASESSNWIVENLKTIGIALLIALVIRAFLFQPFNIPSGSMKGTLLVGDYLFVSKYSYGYSRHSLPFSPPVMSGRIFAGTPERGDIIVFKLPEDNRTDYIKRLVGLPGDRIQMIDGVLHINGEAVKREPAGDFEEFDKYGVRHTIPQYRETLPNGVSYLTLDMDPDSKPDNTIVYEVPPGHYFMMGDNRDSSRDSRFEKVGFVPEENLVGRAEILFFSVNGAKAQIWEIWKWPVAIRWGRIFNTLG